MGIRTPNIRFPILSLSGGNQQKVLIARALASRANLILLDDPTRGIDVTTKWDLYKRVREEASRGRSFLWYTTEYDELDVCDRVYVFYEGRITDEIGHAELSEERVLKASFAKVQADAA
jgi:ribose transport system ATP-binding protein